MKWIAAQLTALNPDRSWRVFDAENYEPQNGRNVYRFFELFDLPNLPRVGELMNAAAEGRVSVTPPFKPYLEEKMWFALFWLQPLREFWRRELGEKYFLKLQKVIPYTWLLDPTPLPQHAVIPRLEIHDWREASPVQPERARSLIESEWIFSARLGESRCRARRGLAAQRMAKANRARAGNFRTIAHDSCSVSTKAGSSNSAIGIPKLRELKTMKGRVRLCPYYFVETDKVKMRGALATVAPADKKLLHGMRDAILVPSQFVKQ